jgi:hypothetical protein
MVKLARTLGRVAWAIDIPSPRAEAYRDTRGPGLEGWKALLVEARAKATTPNTTALSLSPGASGDLREFDA